MERSDTSEDIGGFDFSDENDAALAPLGPALSHTSSTSSMGGGGSGGGGGGASGGHAGAGGGGHTPADFLALLSQLADREGRTEPHLAEGRPLMRASSVCVVHA